MKDCRSDFPCPGIVRAMTPYRSPVSGRLIETRHERVEDLKRTGCIDARDLRGVRLADGSTHEG